ncbi:hypothetical protein SSX86_013329 [Deinandra increscens subsp. villosa]|uniref:Uncharacterized protein n=1 Tax=Deinandra increscens subsp. villosa TaxID=3103831 RepID=A0AAP0DA49_9ASTR
MGKVRGKAKRSSIITNIEDGSGGEERLPVRRRGRPTKGHKEAEKISEKNDTKLESQLDTENKRKRSSLETDEESLEMLDDENVVRPETNGLGLTKAIGFRHNGSRRKNKPRRAAEVGVSVYEVCSWLVLRS